MKKTTKKELIRRDAEVKAAIAVLGIVTICLIPGIVFLVSLVEKLGL